MTPWDLALKERRLRTVALPQTMLAGLLTSPRAVLLHPVELLPEDALLLRMHLEPERQLLHLVFLHPRFEPVGPANVPPAVAAPGSQVIRLPGCGATPAMLADLWEKTPGGMAALLSLARGIVRAEATRRGLIDQGFSWEGDGFFRSLPDPTFDDPFADVPFAEEETTDE